MSWTWWKGAFVFSQQNDSIDVYQKIKQVAERNKFTNLLYHSVFVDPKPQEYPVEPSSHEEKIVNPYLQYERRIIRKVQIIVRDPYHFSKSDSADIEDVFLERVANTLHIRSRNWVIANKLLFKRGDTLNALRISESERLIRGADYINDAAIYIMGTEASDSVDVNVVVQDKWSVTVPVVLTDIGGNIRIREQNVLGLGHQFEQYGAFNRSEFTDFSGSYNISNIDHSFIAGRIFYELKKDLRSAGMAFERGFYSPLAKWAYGLTAIRSQSYYLKTDANSNGSVRSSVNRSDMDAWLGRNFKLKSKRKFFDQSTNIMTAIRFYTGYYDKRPPLSDLQNRYLNSWSLVGSTGLSVQQYYKDRYIYRFGNNEDIPQGFLVQLLYGIKTIEQGRPEYYFGFELSRAKRVTAGYISSSVSYGVFFNKFISNKITINYRFNYISNLYKVNDWYIRQFLKLKLVYGDNKGPAERLRLKEEELYGLKNSLPGTSKMFMNYELVAYAPYNVIGFRIAPVLLTGAGVIGDINKTNVNGNIYQAYALGIMLRNEKLLVNTFQVSVGYYPYNDGVIRYNPITSFTLKVSGFSVSKPGFIGYD